MPGFYAGSFSIRFPGPSDPQALSGESRSSTILFMPTQDIRIPEQFMATSWNLVVNLGIKCNTSPISRNAGIRYFSSPFDNVDTVHGLVDAARLMAKGFKGYMEDVADWNIQNIYSKGKIITKSLTHRDVPGIQYPHFHAGWTHGTLTKEDIQRWAEKEETDILTIWPYLKDTFTRRQQRLISLLGSRNHILFLRIDTPNHYVQVYKRNQAGDLQQFMEIMKAAYPDTTFGLLYFYYNTGKYQRLLEPSESLCPVLIPEGSDADLETFVLEKIRLLKILPREQLEPCDFQE